MGVDYTAVLMAGKEFESPSEAYDFLVSKGIKMPDEDSPEMEDGLEEYLCSSEEHDDLEFEQLNYYGRYDGGVLGWHIPVHPPSKFADTVANTMENWKKLFGEDAEIIHTVKVW